jgi:cyclophilin family peptidyl-prolyl cis-trans isomerase
MAAHLTGCAVGAGPGPLADLPSGLPPLFDPAMRTLLTTLALLCLARPAVAQEAPSAPVRVTFETTAGVFVVELDAARAPLSTANFVQYVRDGHYDGTIFHRVIGNFVVQGGGYTADGAEKPTRAAIPNESGNGQSNRRGTVAMARHDDPHSATSQFYVNLTDNLGLDPAPTRWGYAVIGRVDAGMDVIDKIASVATGSKAPFGDDVPIDPVIVTRASIVGAAR